MNHCGAAEVNRLELSAIALPEATRSYCPFGHAPFLTLVEEKMNEVGFTFGENKHALTKDGARYFGLIQLLGGVEQKQHALMLAIRNSYDKAFAATIGFGAIVFVCDNLSLMAENKLGRKHTTNIERDLPGLILSCVSNTRVMQHTQDQRFERYQDQNVTDAKADRLIIDMVRRNAINPSHVGKVVQEWYDPTIEDADGNLIDHGPKRVWRLFNAATQALKGTPIHDMPRRTIELQAICDDHSRFTPQFKIAA